MQVHPKDEDIVQTTSKETYSGSELSAGKMVRLQNYLT
jgi:hypothetical protein